MKDKLMMCFYDNMSVEQAVKFIEKSYNVKITNKVIENVKTTIKKQNGKEWN